MSQQINLFNPIFLKQKKYFSAVTMAQALGLILLGSAALAGYARYQLAALSKEAEATAAQLTMVQSQLHKINAMVASRQKTKSLEDDVKKMEAELQALDQVSEILKKGDFGNTHGYAEYMRAFSRQIVNGVWLTGFTIHGAGTEIGIQGRALQADLVPSYISHLKREPVLQGKSFATLEMQAADANRAGHGDGGTIMKTAAPAYIEFRLQSSGIGKEQTGILQTGGK